MWQWLILHDSPCRFVHEIQSCCNIYFPTTTAWPGLVPSTSWLADIPFLQFHPCTGWRLGEKDMAISVSPWLNQVTCTCTEGKQPSSKSSVVKFIECSFDCSPCQHCRCVQKVSLPYAWRRRPTNWLGSRIKVANCKTMAFASCAGDHVGKGS